MYVAGVVATRAGDEDEPDTENQPHTRSGVFTKLDPWTEMVVAVFTGLDVGTVDDTCVADR